MSGGHVLKCNVEFFRDTHSSPVTGKVTHRPTKVGKYSVWGSVRGVCGGGSVRNVCGGECEGWVWGEDVGWVCGGKDVGCVYV